MITETASIRRSLLGLRIPKIIQNRQRDEGRDR
jgi:hypothetical protein